MFSSGSRNSRKQNGRSSRRRQTDDLPKVKWMAAARLLTVKDFSEASLVSTMKSAWNAAKEVLFRPIGKNLFIVQAFCLGDWKRIMEKGPVDAFLVNTPIR